MAEKTFTVNCEITKIKTVLFLAMFLIIGLPFWLGSESQTVTSYYTVPHGTYDRLYGGTLKAGAINNYLQAGRGNRTVGGQTLTNVDYFYSNAQLYVRSAGGTINLSPASKTVTFLNDAAGYSPYVRSFCRWQTSCSSGYLPMAKGSAVGKIRYGISTPTRKLCCRMTIL